MFKLVLPALQSLLWDIPNIEYVERELRIELVDLWFYNLNTNWDGLTHNRSYKDYIENLEQPMSDNLKCPDWSADERAIEHRYFSNYDAYSYILTTAFNRIALHIKWLLIHCPQIGQYDPSLMVVSNMSSREIVVYCYKTLEEYNAYARQHS